MLEDEEELALLEAVDVLGLLDDARQAAAVAVLHDEQLERILIALLI